MRNTYSSLLARWLPRSLAALGLLLATAGAAQAQTTTSFAYTGDTQRYTVPAGVTAIQVVATGASGGVLDINPIYRYAPGAQVQATLLVTPGEVLTVVVGGRGGNSATNYAGGFNGGGAGHVDGGGGGATDLQRAGTSTSDYLTSRNALLVAGGGGGSATGGNKTGTGGSGGTPNGGDGEVFSVEYTGNAGKGATQTGPGAAGGSGASIGKAGSNGTGGDGNSTFGGGGGGGYYGGGGGSTYGSGGGGSSWVTPIGSSNVSYSVATTTPADGALSITPVTIVNVQYQTGDLGQPTDNQLRPFLQLVNTGTTAVPYSSLTIRYWLTAENFMGQLVTPIDYAKLGTSFVSARYVQLATPRQGAFGYIEYSFAAAAGNLAAGTDSGPIYGKAYKPDYSNFDETDDWSYQTSGSFTTNTHVTLYQNGTLIGGTEPPAVTSTTAVQVLSASRDASPSTQYVSVQLQVRNTGNVPFNYDQLRVRYYFTRDGATTVVPELDYAQLGNGSINLRVVNLPAPVGLSDAYLELLFTAGPGVFYPRSSTGDILVKLRKENYQAFDQTNDYSFSSATSLTLNDRITALVSNRLVFGTPPAGAPAIVAPASQETAARASADDAAATTRGPLEFRLTASPNPATDQVHLQFALPYTQAYTLAVYDGQGRLVQQLASSEAQAGQAQELEVPTQTYEAGLYLVRLTTATDVQYLKLIKH